MLKKEIGSVLFLFLLLRLVNSAEINRGKRTRSVREVRRDEFPLDFVFGAGTSAYQYEGAAAEDGRSPSIWDTFTHAGGMGDNSTGDVASDGYHKYKEDVKLMSEIGLEGYRFSISWSRLIPNGRGEINPKGLEYYNNLINELLKHGIQPHISLHHLDLPQILEDEYNGWLSRKIVDDFTAYADVCFREFGDRVSHWTTMVEPNIVSQAAYDAGIWPPCRCSYPFGINCNGGNSTREPYIAIHNMLLAHASVVTLYKRKYQAVQNGSIGINVYSSAYYPLTNTKEDIEACNRASDFTVGWILSPLVFGDYPERMRRNAGRRLPSFAIQESKMVKGSFDFIGLNFYFSFFVGDNPKSLESTVRDFSADMSIVYAEFKNATPTSQFVPKHTPMRPSSLHQNLDYIRRVYGNVPIYIQENGYFNMEEKTSLHDTMRVIYLKSFIASTLKAIRNGSDIRGYFFWGLMDVFEFLSGYTYGMGLYYVDFNDPELPRVPKNSANWYATFLKNSSMKKINRNRLDLNSFSKTTGSWSYRAERL